VSEVTKHHAAAPGATAGNYRKVSKSPSKSLTLCQKTTPYKIEKCVYSQKHNSLITKIQVYMLEKCVSSQKHTSIITKIQVYMLFLF